MRYKILFILAFGYALCGFSQNTKDVDFLKNMSYLKNVSKHVKKCNLDSTSGSSIEQRICLNFELRRTDSLMLGKFKEVLNKIENDSLKAIVRKHQTNWEAERKNISMLKSYGLESNTEANMYMYYMIKLTELRILTLNYILEENY
jgi:hypothetical protein